MRIVGVCLPSFFLSVTVFLFGPFQIYLTNYYDFSVGSWELFGGGLVLAVGGTSLLSLLILAHGPDSPYRRFTTVSIFSVGVLLYLQGNVIVWNYGILDGRDFNWQRSWIKAILDFVLWVSLLSFALIKSTWVLSITVKVCAVLIAFQLFTALYYFSHLPVLPSFKKYSFDESNKFIFSNDKNVIIVVLDSFQSDLFQEILNSDNSYFDVFDGFTYFRNALAGHPFTETSTMNMLTGKFYTGNVTFENHNEVAYSGDSLPKVLKREGYNVELYPHIMRSAFYSKDIVSNIRDGINLRNVAQDYATLLDLSLFRSLPTILKSLIYNSGTWFLQGISAFYLESNRETSIGNDSDSQQTSYSKKAFKHSESVRFLLQMSSHAKKGNDEGVFRYFHLDLPHWPLRINESLEYERMSNNRESFRRQCVAALKIVASFLNKLKSIDAYNNSLVFVVADHGAGAQMQEFLKPAGYPESDNLDVVSEWFMINALPVFLAKPIQSRGPLKISDAPVSLSDIPKTVFSELGIDNTYVGFSIFPPNGPFDRERRYVIYEKYDSVNDCYPSVTEWIVNGYPWILSSWQPSHRLFTSEGIVGETQEAYKLGRVIDFGSVEKSQRYQLYGWSRPSGESSQTEFTWSIGKRSALKIPFKPPHNPILLTIDATGYLPEGKRINQRAIVSVNGEKLGEWRIAEKKDYNIIIPNKILKSDEQQLIFDLPDAISPYETVDSVDTRKLGIAVRSVLIKEIPHYVYGKTIDFRKNGNSIQYLVNGWSDAAPGFIWTIGRRSELNIPISSTVHDLNLQMHFIPYLGEGKLKSQRVRVFANEHEIAEWEVKVNDKYQALIPKNTLPDHGVLRLHFELPDAVSPKSLGLSEDTRDIALAFVEMKIVEAVSPDNTPQPQKGAITNLR